MFVLGIGGLLILGLHGITIGGNTTAGNVCIYECSLFSCLGTMLWALSGCKVGILQWGPLTYIGKISYTMYLVHLGFICVFWYHLDDITIAFVAFVLTVAYASASWYLMERRLLGNAHRPRTPVPVSA